MMRTVMAFRAVKKIIAQKFPSAASVNLIIGCPIAEKDHKDSPRQYAHALHLDNVICVTHKMEELPTKNLVGIFFHEFGHILGGNEENEADMLIMENFNIVIKYRTELNLQEI